MTEPRSWTQWPRAAAESSRVFLQDTGHGLLEVCHSSLALLGLVVLTGTVLFTAGHAELKHDAEHRLRSWLQERQTQRERQQMAAAAAPLPAGTTDLATALAEPSAILRATALDPAELDRQQSAIAHWISRRYRVAPEPIGRLVQEAWDVGRQAQLDPTLILAIMAIESSFNPFAQSPVGAQGLMQVMTRVHQPKYVAFGGNHAAFDPVTNLRVGVQVLKECIQRAGSLERGLKFYVGAANLADDGGYAAKVLGEQALMRQVATAQSVVARAPGAGTPLPEPASEPALLTPVSNPPPAPRPPMPGRAEAPLTPEQVALLR